MDKLAKIIIKLLKPFWLILVLLGIGNGMTETLPEYPEDAEEPEVEG